MKKLILIVAMIATGLTQAQSLLQIAEQAQSLSQIVEEHGTPTSKEILSGGRGLALSYQTNDELKKFIFGDDFTLTRYNTTSNKITSKEVAHAAFENSVNVVNKMNGTTPTAFKKDKVYFKTETEFIIVMFRKKDNKYYHTVVFALKDHY